MARPSTRQELLDYCLRRCGAPVIEINIDAEQQEDAIDRAVDLFTEHHVDGSSQQFYMHVITQDDIDRGYIVLPEDIYSVNRVFDFESVSTSTGGESLFSIDYQLKVEAMKEMRNMNISAYYAGQQYLAMLDDVFNEELRIRFTRHTQRLYIDDPGYGVKYGPGVKIAIDVGMVTDPEIHGMMYGNRVLRDLAAAYTREQWGYNLIKFAEITLPSGVTLNGERILAEAKADIERLEEDFINKYSAPLGVYFG